MTEVPLNADVELAIGVAVAGSALAMEHFRRGLSIDTKPDGTVVTEADLAVETLLRSRLHEARPHDAILGEEGGATGRSARRWILDPIDGTTNFIAGRTDWGVHVALEAHGEIVLGVITRPAQGAIWWAATDLGAHRATLTRPDDSTQLRVSTAAELDSCRLTSWTSTDPCSLQQLTGLPGWETPLDLDAGLRVAAGDLDLLVEQSPARIWDRAPYVVLVEEAGGCFADLNGGRDPDAGGCVLSNGLVDEPLARLLAEQ
jgi:histidinol-phosphatase